MTSNVSFLEFFAAQAAIEKWNHIPLMHKDIICFLSDIDNWNNDQAVLQVFRNGAKSTIVATFIVWMLVNNPKLIFLVQSADNALAKKMIGDCQKIIRQNPYAQKLSNETGIWTASGFRVKGAISGRNLSVDARGIFSNVTGSRADIIIYDDVEVPKNSATSDLRDKLRSRISESAQLLNPHGKRLFVGTPHNEESIYPELLAEGASELTIPFLTQLQGEFPNYTGKCAWAERFNPHNVQQRQKNCRSKVEFMSQMQLVPINSDESYFEIDNIKSYDKKLNLNGLSMRIGDISVKTIKAYWDPSKGSDKGDDSVLTVGFVDTHGEIYIHRQVFLKGDADSQCEQCVKTLKECKVPHITIESNGVGSFLKPILEKYTRGLGITVVDEHTTSNKQQFIINQLSMPLLAKILNVHVSVMDNIKFIRQLRDFNPKRKNDRDDCIDCTAKLISKLPVLIGRGKINDSDGFEPWREYGGIVEYSTSW